MADTGATAHMLRSTTGLDASHPDSGNTRVTFGNGKSLPVSRIGSTTINNAIPLKNVLVVPNITKDLLSISPLTNDSPVDVLFSNNFFHIQDRKTAEVIARGTCENGFYVLSQGHKSLLAALSVSHLRASFDKWHSRLGHVAFDTISVLNKLGHVFLTSLLPKLGLCSSCQLSKAHRLPFIENEKRSSHVLDLIHCDLWGPAPIMSTDGYLYYVIFVDDFSRCTWFYPLKAKSDFFSILGVFLNFVQNQFSTTIKVFQSDGGTKFTNNRIQQFFQHHGIQHRISCPHTPQQNGRAERKHRHITETGLAMMFNSHAPANLWVDAFTSATYIINRLPRPILENKSPFEVLFKHPPSYANFRVFGCRVFLYLRDYTKHKLQPRSASCIFIGYSLKYKGYRCLDPTTSRVYTTRHAKFDEDTFSFSGKVSPIDEATLVFSNFDDTLPTPTTLQKSPTPPHTSHSSPTHSLCKICPLDHCDSHSSTGQSLPTHQDHIPSQTQPTSAYPLSNQIHTSPNTQNHSAHTTPDTPNHSAQNLNQTVQLSPPPFTAPTSSSQPTRQTHNPSTTVNLSQPTSSSTSQFDASRHPMTTRSKSGIFKPKHFADLTDFSSNQLHHALFVNHTPKGYKTAAKNPKWVVAMHDEINALQNNNTWELVQRPTHSNVVGSKSIYRIKYKSDGSLDRYKARLVAQGFTQVPGLDFSHTFSPVVKSSTIRVVLSLATIFNWKLRQLDVNNAFLNGHLTETVYMEQPSGFVNPKFPNHVCKLNRALYGLKQAPRAWFQRLSAFLLTLGFHCSRADPSLFIYKKNNTLIYLLVYVDDVILTGNDEKVLNDFTTRLHTEFKLKDLGSLSYFLGLEVTHTSSGLFLSQAKYAYDIRTRAGLLDSKPVATPLTTTDTFTSNGTPFQDPTFYRSIVGALQYLTITRPDLSYAVNQASQYLQNPTTTHFQLVKRILRYVKGTLSYGLSFDRPIKTTLVGYSDADWARCVETRWSTCGYSIYLGGNLVSWSAKKQPTVSRSSCESEYRAMANTAAEIIWLTHLLRELNALPTDRPTLLCDNKSALFLSQNPVSHKRSKHIDIDYHFVRELVSSGQLHTKFIPTKLQVADIFTKSLPIPLFERFRTMLRVGPPIRLKGGNNR
ncbi:putative RNA-directed DNA polymerase [Helianthus annuus]|nr:putative RNA-directed DNA polymerase [Helianthus annuus]